MTKRYSMIYILTLIGVFLLIGAIASPLANKIKTSEAGTLLFAGSSLMLLTSLIKKKLFKPDKI